MTFDLVRSGWPNIVPILALSLLPVFAMMADRRTPPYRIASAVLVDMDPQPDCAVRVAGATTAPR
jgi:hypothetical protein